MIINGDMLLCDALSGLLLIFWPCCSKVLKQLNDRIADTGSKEVKLQSMPGPEPDSGATLLI